MAEKIQIEKIVQQRLTAEGRNVAWLCRELHWQRKKYYRFLFNGLIEVHDLQNISILLNYDFLQYFSLPFIEKAQKWDKLDTNVGQNEYTVIADNLDC